MLSVWVALLAVKKIRQQAWAAMAALAAFKLKRPVKLVLSRNEDMRLTGKRHPYSSDFKIGLKNDGQILAYEVTFYQNAGRRRRPFNGNIGKNFIPCNK